MRKRKKLGKERIQKKERNEEKKEMMEEKKEKNG